MTPKLYALLAALSVLLVSGISGCVYVKHLEKQAAEAKAAKVTAKALDQVATTITVNREKADDAVKSVQEAPSADQPVPPDVLDAWAVGIDRLRDHKRPGKP